MTKFKPQIGKGSFGSGLANLLITIGDTKTADKAFNEYFSSRFYSKYTGIDLLLSTVAVRELTANKYDGRLFIDINLISPSDIYITYDGVHDKKTIDNFVELYMQEKQDNKIMPLTSRTYKKYPTIQILEHIKYFGGHAVVALNDKSYIDYGQKCSQIELEKKGRIVEPVAYIDVITQP
ncbi:hypothetical protein D6777_00335 [Candidatus Woesearchaeota archaeon]|nr:MAG: hypothetical protein D6777_00335 [Candidatus Woesearchaeota archaeon]